MADPDSMFLFEIIVEELQSYINCKEFCIRNQFADIFNMNLRDPNEMGSFLPKRPKKVKLKRKSKINTEKPFSDRHSTTSKVQAGQSILFANSIDSLISNMKQYPMELSLWSKVIPDYKIGSTHIPWSSSYFEYLNKLYKKPDLPPVCVTGDYNVFDEFTSKRMAVIKLNIKLSYLRDRINTQFRSLSQENDQIFMYTGYISKNSSVLSTVKNKPIIFSEETGVIKTIYSGGKQKLKKSSRDIKKDIKNYVTVFEERGKNEHISKFDFDNRNDNIINRKYKSDIFLLVKSDTNINIEQSAIKAKSCSSINQENFNILNYVFGGSTGPFGNKVYCVGYFTVENDFADSGKSDSPGADSPKSESVKDGSPKSVGSPVANSPKSAGSPTAETPNYASSPKLDTQSAGSPITGSNKFLKLQEPKSPMSAGPANDQTERADEMKMKERYKFQICDTKCQNKKTDTGSCTQSTCSLDLPQEASNLITMKKCDQVVCNHRTMRKLPTPPDDRILLDLSNLKKDCCDVTEKLEEVVGGLKAKMKFGDDPCFCECECRFGFTKRTTYCNICGGYETAGEDKIKKMGYDMSFPCPIFHKLAERGKMKTLSTSGSESKKKDGSKQKSAVDKSIESEKETTKKGKRKKKDDRFKFNYGYTGIPPQIGHSRCAMPCAGTLGVVPKKMGWLWNAENIPGMKYRPLWKPGAANKHVVRLLKIAKNPDEALAKKRKKVLGKPKRPLKRPLLIVQKTDGEYTVTMETMKTFTKPRTFNQYPYEDKPLVTYTIGRTEEENRERKKKKEQARRRLERLQREFVQSAFKDMCQEICLKTYQQALAILPDAECPDCPCYPAEPGPDKTDLEHSCSCSEDKSLSESDTDSDEWIVEFTPPNATFDPSFKSKKVISTDNSSQYSYMDYKVKLLDRYGNPVPRFFKGPDGKQQCSDLGGFWSPDHKWLEINTDGYIGPDERWAPNIFIGPNDEQVDGETGKFQILNGKWFVVGVDGYVDSQGKWKFYPKPKSEESKKRRIFATRKKVVTEKKEENAGLKPSEATWSCFGSVSPKQLSKMGIVGHGHDKKLLLSALQDMLAQGEDVVIPEPSTVPRIEKKGKRQKRRTSDPYAYDSNTHNLVDRRKCKHATPSDKGIVAVDEYGNKTYFRLKDFINKRPKERMAALTHQGISLSSFHVPCFNSFINSELMKKQQYERLLALSKGANANHKCTTTSTHAD